ncbi:MAG: hypothetical protein Q8Q21_01860, partial [bacterium]|nr:hypothetical protein [bacterium]
MPKGLEVQVLSWAQRSEAQLRGGSKATACFACGLEGKFYVFLKNKISAPCKGKWRNNEDEVLAKLFFGVRKCGTLSQDFERFVFKMR